MAKWTTTKVYKIPKGAWMVIQGECVEYFRRKNEIKALSNKPRLNEWEEYLLSWDKERNKLIYTAVKRCMRDFADDYIEQMIYSIAYRVCPETLQGSTGMRWRRLCAAEIGAMYFPYLARDPELLITINRERIRENQKKETVE